MNHPDTPLSHDDQRQHMLVRLEGLPQWTHIQSSDASRWIESVIEHEAHRADWHIDRLFGVTGSEIGALVGALHGQFHPFSSAHHVTRAKLLLDPIEPTSGDCARAIALEPQLRALYRSRLLSRGGHVRDDLMEKIICASRQHSSWQVGTPPEIVEEDGNIYMVDYKCPGDSVVGNYEAEGVPFYHQAQLHHYRKMAANAGVHVDGLRLCSLDYRRWDVDERSVEIDEILADQIREAGSFYWNEHVLKGQPSPTMMITSANALENVKLDIGRIGEEGRLVAEHDLSRRQDEGKSLVVKIGEGHLLDQDDLKQRLGERALRFLAWGMAEGEASKMREMLQQSVGELLPVDSIPVDMDRIDAGHVRFRIDREFDEQAVVDAAIALLARDGYDHASAISYLEQPNFWTPAEFSSEGLMDAIRQSFNVDPDTDPRFAAACVKSPRRRIDTLLAMVKEMDPDHAVANPQTFVKGGRVRMELARTPLVGPLRGLREKASEDLRTALAPIQNVAEEYVSRKEQMETQLAVSKPARASRKKGSP